MVGSDHAANGQAGGRNGHDAGGRPMRVEFLVDGELSDTVLAHFPELQVARGPAGGTALYGTVLDRAHLEGLMSRFSDLGIALVEFRQLPD